MKFLVTATPVHVPMLSTGSLDTVRQWHEAHTSIGCIMRIQATGSLVGLLDAQNRDALERELASYPEHGCYAWSLQPVMPMMDACAHDRELRRAAGVLRPVRAGRDGSIFPDWMTPPNRSDGMGSKG